MAEVFKVNEDTIRNLQGLKEDRSNIVKVKGRLQVARPPRSREERERLERQEREDEREQSESHRGGHGRGREEREQEERQKEREEEREQERGRRESQRGGRGGYNGIEETLCTLRLRENIHDPSRADIYNPHAGRISTLNSHNLPVLRWLQLSAEFGRLQRVRALVSIIKKKKKKVIMTRKLTKNSAKKNFY